MHLRPPRPDCEEQLAQRAEALAKEQLAQCAEALAKEQLAQRAHARRRSQEYDPLDDSSVALSDEDLDGTVGFGDLAALDPWSELPP